MHGLVELLLEILTILVYAFGMGVLTALGLLAERTGFVDIVAGETVVGLWLIAVGAVALFAGVYMLGYRSLWPRLRTNVRRLRDAR